MAEPEVQVTEASLQVRAEKKSGEARAAERASRLPMWERINERTSGGGRVGRWRLGTTDIADTGAGVVFRGEMGVLEGNLIDGRSVVLE